MSELWQIVGLGFVVPCGVTLVVGLVIARRLPAGVSTRYVLATAFAVGLLVGYGLLPSWAHLIPQRHWQWLPYVGASAAFVSGLGQATGLARLERALLCGLWSAVAALVLVPDWDSLQPARWAWCVGFLGYAWALTLALHGFLMASGGLILVTGMLLATGAVTILTAAFVSLTYGQLGGVVTAAVAGCWVVTLRRNDPTMVRGWIPAGCLVLVGCALIGCIEPQEPLYGVLMVPLAPLLTLLTDRFLVSQWTTRARWLGSLAAGLVPILMAAGWVFWSTRGVSPAEW